LSTTKNRKQLKMSENQDRILSVSEIAEYLGICRSKAFQLVHSEGFPSWRIGRRILVRENDLNNWIEEQILIQEEKSNE
jgi:excisionase family DNA binding protein